MTEECFCAKCNSASDNILALNCNHHLCILCAAENLSRQDSKGAKEKKIKCDFCQRETQLDSDIIRQILSFAKSAGTLESNIEIPWHSASYILPSQIENPFTTSSPSPRQETFHIAGGDKNNLNIQNYLDNNKSNTICKEHDEPITYLCFDCMSKLICSECVVHGIHKNHDVIHIKKAYPIIVEKTNELNEIVNDRIKGLNGINKTIESKKNDIIALNEKVKQEIQVAFEEIRIKLNKKEQEILDRTEAVLNDQLQELTTYSRVIQAKAISLNKIVDTIQSNLIKTDDLSLVNFYSENKNKILASSDITEFNNLNMTANIKNFKVEMDKTKFESMINAMNNLSYEIKGFQNLGMNNQIDTNRYQINRNLYGFQNS